ncbi:uncharacterized protein DNG_05280 [Cephalotrichum gorgonifer]|uniref:Cadmium resistance transporter n=1 Tax=Cephalotrichum gorgonifer TaxID=2041049 RepID=A0AAE8N0L1_9PEZI|nr:uncharacterized protein DNG_05280 [Cephalotrichum gorgonifer]
MEFGKTLGTACATFAITNIDDIFVLVTFFAESSTSRTLTPARIVIGQYVGFTALVVVSMIGFGASFLFPTEPIGFLGLLPILLGIWRLFSVLLPNKEAPETLTTAEVSTTTAPSNTVGIWTVAGMKSIFKVAGITVINGGDNIGTYIPLFSQARGAEIAVYIITFYVLLGVWCLAAFLVMKQKHILNVAQKYARIGVPFLYLGLGIFIVVQSECYPWSIEQIDDRFLADPGIIIMAVVTTFTLLSCIGAMLWIKLRKRRVQAPPEAEGLEPGSSEGRSPASQNEESKPLGSPEACGTDQGIAAGLLHSS